MVTPRVLLVGFGVSVIIGFFGSIASLLQVARIQLFAVSPRV